MNFTIGLIFATSSFSFVYGASPTPHQSIDTLTYAVGSTMYVSPTGGQNPCLPTYQSVVSADHAADNNDQATFDAVMRSAIIFDDRTLVKVLKRATADRPLVFVAALNGKFKERRCWYPADARLFTHS